MVRLSNIRSRNGTPEDYFTNNCNTFIINNPNNHQSKSHCISKEFNPTYLSRQNSIIMINNYDCHMPCQSDVKSQVTSLRNRICDFYDNSSSFIDNQVSHFYGPKNNGPNPYKVLNKLSKLDEKIRNVEKMIKQYEFHSSRGSGDKKKEWKFCNIISKSTDSLITLTGSIKNDLYKHNDNYCSLLYQDQNEDDFAQICNQIILFETTLFNLLKDVQRLESFQNISKKDVHNLIQKYFESFCNYKKEIPKQNTCDLCQCVLTNYYHTLPKTYSISNIVRPKHFKGLKNDHYGYCTSKTPSIAFNCRTPRISCFKCNVMSKKKNCYAKKSSHYKLIAGENGNTFKISHKIKNRCHTRSSSLVLEKNKVKENVSKVYKIPTYKQNLNLQTPNQKCTCSEYWPAAEKQRQYTRYCIQADCRVHNSPTNCSGNRNLKEMYQYNAKNNLQSSSSEKKYPICLEMSNTTIHSCESWLSETSTIHDNHGKLHHISKKKCFGKIKNKVKSTPSIDRMETCRCKCFITSGDRKSSLKKKHINYSSKLQTNNKSQDETRASEIDTGYIQNRDIRTGYKRKKQHDTCHQANRRRQQTTTQSRSKTKESNKGSIVLSREKLVHARRINVVPTNVKPSVDCCACNHNKPHYRDNFVMVGEFEKNRPTNYINSVLNPIVKSRKNRRNSVVSLYTKSQCIITHVNSGTNRIPYGKQNTKPDENLGVQERIRQFEKRDRESGIYYSNCVQEKLKPSHLDKRRAGTHQNFRHQTNLRQYNRGHQETYYLPDTNKRLDQGYSKERGTRIHQNLRTQENFERCNTGHQGVGAYYISRSHERMEKPHNRDHQEIGGYYISGTKDIIKQGPLNTKSDGYCQNFRTQEDLERCTRCYQKIGTHYGTRINERVGQGSLNILDSETKYAFGTQRTQKPYFNFKPSTSMHISSLSPSNELQPDALEMVHQTMHSGAQYSNGIQTADQLQNRTYIHQGSNTHETLGTQIEQNDKLESNVHQTVDSHDVLQAMNVVKKQNDGQKYRTDNNAVTQDDRKLPIDILAQKETEVHEVIDIGELKVVPTDKLSDHRIKTKNTNSFYNHFKEKQKQPYSMNKKKPDGEYSIHLSADSRKCFPDGNVSKQVILPNMHINTDSRAIKLFFDPAGYLQLILPPEAQVFESINSIDSSNTTTSTSLKYSSNSQEEDVNK